MSALQNLIEPKIAEIRSLCRRYGVRRLAVFGSTVRDDFDQNASDADFIVEFEPRPIPERMRNYFDLRQALSSLLSRRIDLVEDGSIRNPYILRRVKNEQQVLYAA